MDLDAGLALACSVASRWCLTKVSLDDIDEHDGYQPLAVTTYHPSCVTLDRRSIENLTEMQVVQLVLHEVAHVMIERVPCEMVSIVFASTGCDIPLGSLVHSHSCKCFNETTGHCIHWRRIARGIGYVDAFTFTPPDEEREPIRRGRRRSALTPFLPRA